MKQNHEIFCSFPVREMRPTCDDHNFSKSRSWIASFGTFAGLGLGIQGFFSQIDRLRCAGRIRKNDFVCCSLLFFVGERSWRFWIIRRARRAVVGCRKMRVFDEISLFFCYFKQEEVEMRINSKTELG